MPKSSAPKSVESLSYEQAFAELESIVAALRKRTASSGRVDGVI